MTTSERKTGRRKRVHFTVDRVAEFACDPGKAQTFFWDDEARGLGVRVTAGGAKSYIFEGWLHGKGFRMTIGSLRELPIDGPSGETRSARFEARRLKSLVDLGIDPRQLEKRAKFGAARAQARALHWIALLRGGFDLIEVAWEIEAVERASTDKAARPLAKGTDEVNDTTGGEA